jgi:Uma2 family endonuclease
MSSAKQPTLISVADYLAGELVSEVKHEYINGVVHAMTGGTNAHSMIATNTLLCLGGQLEDSSCRAFNSDAKVRVQTSSGTRFYYPDVQVVCKPNAQTDQFQDSPVLVVEVLSASTRRIDQGEKKDSYLSIGSLQVYLMLEQQSPSATLYLRTESGFECVVVEGPDAVIELEALDVKLPLSALYRDIVFE